MGTVKRKPQTVQRYPRLYRQKALDRHRRRFLGEARLALPPYTRTAFMVALLGAIAVGAYLFLVAEAFTLW